MPGPVAPAAAPGLRDASRGLEEVLIKEMLSAMSRAQLESGGFFGADATGGTRQTTFEVFLSQALAETEPLGIADRLAVEIGRDPAAARAAAGTATFDPAGLVFRNLTLGAQVEPGPAEKEGGDSPTGRQDTTRVEEDAR
jgi:Rod binding domain-containing protein